MTPEEAQRFENLTRASAALVGVISIAKRFQEGDRCVDAPVSLRAQVELAMQALELVEIELEVQFPSRKARKA